jgi:hypothetical protein
MTDLQLTLTDEERTFLAEFLQKSLKEMRVEEHRTRAPSYREFIIEREQLIDGLLHKLGAMAV